MQVSHNKKNSNTDPQTQTLYMTWNKYKYKNNPQRYIIGKAGRDTECRITDTAL